MDAQLLPSQRPWAQGASTCGEEEERCVRHQGRPWIGQVQFVADEQAIQLMTHEWSRYAFGFWLRVWSPNTHYCSDADFVSLVLSDWLGGLPDFVLIALMTLGDWFLFKCSLRFFPLKITKFYLFSLQIKSSQLNSDAFSNIYFSIHVCKTVVILQKSVVQWQP